VRRLVRQEKLDQRRIRGKKERKTQTRGRARRVKFSVSSAILSYGREVSSYNAVYLRSSLIEVNRATIEIETGDLAGVSCRVN
jgi:hypothetical protein